MEDLINSILEWDASFLDNTRLSQEAIQNLDLPFPSTEDQSSFVAYFPQPQMPVKGCLVDDHPESTVHVSSSFFPGARSSTSDRTLRSSDSVLFYVDCNTLLKASPRALKGFLAVPLDDTRLKDLVIDIPETAPVLNIVLHSMYGISCAKHSPRFKDLKTAVERMPLYGLVPKIHISPSTPMFEILLSHAPLHPIEVYTLAAHFDIHELAVKTSSYLLSYDLSELTDEVVTTMGAIYLRRLMVLHMSLIDDLKSIILQPPVPHPATTDCDFGDQKRLCRAWALASSYLVWDSKADIPIHHLRTTLLALGDHIECKQCKETLRARVKDVVAQWVRVQVVCFPL